MFPCHQIYPYLDSGDLAAFSSTSKRCHETDYLSRRHASIPNCYATTPSRAVTRFKNVTSVCIKGKPHFADFNLVPERWGGGAKEWVAAMKDAWPEMEEIRLKRMMLDDDVMEMIAAGFPKLQVLRLESCEGVTTMGLSKIAATCKDLRVLDLQENEVEDTCPNWLSYFPTSFTSLEHLNVACLHGELDTPVLESLISRCRNLKTLKLNSDVPLENLASLIYRARQLVDLGTGSFLADHDTELYDELNSAFAGCTNLMCLSGLWDPVPSYIPVVYSVCEGLTWLNLSFCTLQSKELVNLITQCKNLRRLWVLDLIEDMGLESVAESCNLLEELRVFPSDPHDTKAISLTETGLVTVSSTCTNLRSILYFCHQFTNEALFTIAKNRPNITHFRLCIIKPYTPDHLTHQPLDAGFSAIVESCKNLKRLSVSGLLTDLVFKSIGAHADKLEMLSVAFVGDSDAGLRYILSGCKSLKKLEIRDCPFGEKVLLENKEKLENMRSLWMSSCNLKLGGCRELARKMVNLNVEVMDESVEGGWESLPDDFAVEKLYVYRTVGGKRSDAPSCVCIL